MADNLSYDDRTEIMRLANEGHLTKMMDLILKKTHDAYLAGIQMCTDELARDGHESARIAVLKQYVGHHSSCDECYKVWARIVGRNIEPDVFPLETKENLAIIRRYMNHEISNEQMMQELEANR